MGTKKTKAPAPIVTLHFFEYVANSIGIYSRSWHATKREAEKERARMIEREGYEPPEGDSLEGNEHEISEVQSARVELTPRGLLTFADHYASGYGA